MINYIISNYPRMIGAAIISILLLFVASRFAWSRWIKTRYISASDKYDATINSILEGIYPDTNSWGRNINDRLKQSIPAVELAVNQFKRFITRKEDIENALQDYKDCCYETTYDEVTKYIMYNKDKGGFDPREMFKARVKKLLKFAENP